MKRNIATIASLALVLSLSGGALAHAEDGLKVNGSVRASVEAGTSHDGNDDKDGDTDKATSTEHGNATSSENKDDDHGNATSSDNNGEDHSMGDAHHSAVSAFVHSLLDVADREGGIGAQVRVIAKAQDDSDASTSEAIAHVENESSLKTFFLGSDYKSLGVIRSAMVKTEKNLTDLKALLAKATSAADKAELEAQIQVLEDDQAALDAFVQAHEGSFSIFGWFVKWFMPTE